MNIYARISNYRIAEPLVMHDGPIDDVFGPDSEWINITAVQPPPAEGWTTADGGKTFSPPTLVGPAPTVRIAAGPTLVKAMTDAQWGSVKPRDQACIAGRDSLAENLDMIARAAGKAGITPKAWFDLALGVIAPTT